MVEADFVIGLVVLLITVISFMAGFNTGRKWRSHDVISDAEDVVREYSGYDERES